MGALKSLGALIAARLERTMLAPVDRLAGWSPAAETASTRGLPSAAPVVIACSGGRDSMALLDAACSVLAPTRIVLAHVHHGLQPEADGWLTHCREAAGRRGIAFEAYRLRPDGSARRFDGLGLEGWARRERYRALATIARARGASAVLTAHHLHDQIETVHLLAERGAGVRGRAGMPAARPIDAELPCVLLLRPFLDVEPARLQAAVRESGSTWVDDPSNDDPRRARTATRRAIADALARDPGALDGLRARLARNKQAWALESQAANEDLAACRLPGQALLSSTRVALLPAERQAAVLRQWLARSGLPMPPRATLNEIVRQMVQGESSRAALSYHGRRIVRHRDRIGVLSALPTPIERRRLDLAAHVTAREPFARHRVEIARPDGAWRACGDAGLIDRLVLDRGRSQDRLRLRADACARSWKNLCQEAAIPVWMRASLPALRDARDGQVLFAAPFGKTVAASEPGRAAFEVRWDCPEAWRDWLACRSRDADTIPAFRVDLTVAEWP